MAVLGPAVSAFRPYFPAGRRVVQGLQPGDSRSPGVLQDTLHFFNPPALLLHRSSTALQAAQTYFLGPQAQVSLPAESS